MNSKKRILTGDRPTGKLHLGHYIGSLQNRVKLQSEYDTFILLADIQALTTHFKNPELMKENILNVAMDNLAVGLDPEKITMLQQSQIPAIAELTIFYSMFVSVNVLRHNPTIKTEAKNYGYGDLTYGFLGYPVSQAADITFCNADLVPVGDDQIPHIELCRKIAKRYNELYGKGENIINLPEVLLSDTPRLVGLDGNDKMGKSLGNAIYLSDDEKTVAGKVNNAVTDPNRIALSDKGNPDICAVSKYHKAFNQNKYDNICEMCCNAKIGCVACKKELIKVLNDMLDPIRERRNFYKSNINLVKEYIKNGNERANVIGNEMILRVKESMGVFIK